MSKKFMKKFMAIAAVSAVLITSSAFAKTEGNYLGIDFLKTSSSNRYQQYGSKSTYPTFDNNSNGVGINYKYAKNFDQIFVAPGVFFDRIGAESKDQSARTLTTNSRYGAKLDLGYDLNDSFALYFTNGVANVNYEVNAAVAGGRGSSSKMGYFYGGGAMAKISNDLSLTVEYNTQTLNIPVNALASADHIKSTLGVAKIGLAYNF